MANGRCFPSFTHLGALALVTGALIGASPGLQAQSRFPGRAVPRGAATLHPGGAPWSFHRGSWYRPSRGAYLGFYPRLGLHLPFLPLGYLTFWFGGAPYYYFDGIYYTDSPSGGYVVADPPPEIGNSRKLATPKAGSPDAEALDTLLIIPKEGQTVDKMMTDRKEAQRYAQERTGYDPAFSDPTDPGTPRARQAYLRAMRSYLEARAYSVK